MNDVITFTNKVSTVSFSFSAETESCEANINGKVETMSLGGAEVFMEALTEGGYEVI